MKKAVGKTLKILVIIALAAGAVYGGYRYTQARGKSEQGEAISYTRVEARTGSLSQQVISTGSLNLPQVEQVKAPIDLKAEAILVQAGDAVEAGTPLLSLDRDSIEQVIKTLETGIAALDSEILSLAAKESDTRSLTAGAAGRVKAIYAAPGESIRKVMARDGGLMLLSLDEKMKVTVPAQTGAAIGGTYTVQSGASVYTGTVVRIEDNAMTLTFPDTKVLPGDTVQVVAGNAVLAQAQAEVNLPYLVTSFLDGTIGSIPVKLNGVHSRTTKLFELHHLQWSDEYRDKVRQRADQWEELIKAKALYADPMLYAPAAGILSEVTAEEGQEALKDDSLLTLYVGSVFEMAVMVDELDIIKVKPGQQASLVMDALPEKTYQAEVSRVSQIGQSSEGITGYGVTLRVSGDEQLKLGMNGTATILTGEQTGVLLVPLAALQSDRQGSYVWLYREGVEATREAPGIKTYVTTGLSDTDYAAVTAGLSAGDEVLVVRSAGAQSAEPGMNFSMPGSGEGTFRQRMEGEPQRPGNGTAPGGSR